MIGTAMRHDVRRALLGTALAAVLNAGAQAETFTLPANPADTVIGALALTSTVYEDTLIDLGRVYGQGYQDMRLANATVDAWLPGEGTEVVIPSLYVLPAAPREGIIVNVPEMRLYYFPRARAGEPARVITHAIGIGREDWQTPHGTTTVVAKVRNPAWYPPESIRKEHAERGDILPRVVPPGPDNPLGLFALRLGIPGYLIHGTNKQRGIGMRVTHGCIRLFPQDIESLFHQVPVGTKVTIINQPFKIGRMGKDLYLEVHPHLEEDAARFQDRYTHVVNLLVDRSKDDRLHLDWTALQQALSRPTGIPEVIGRFAEPLTVADNS